MKDWNSLVMLILLLLLLVVAGIFTEIFKTVPTPEVQEDNAFCAVIGSRPAHYLAQKNDTINIDIGKRQFRNY